MIAMKSNPTIRPAYCIQRHFCLRKNEQCPIRCSPKDFAKGDKHLSPWPLDGNAYEMPVYRMRDL